MEKEKKMKKKREKEEKEEFGKCGDKTRGRKREENEEG